MAASKKSDPADAVSITPVSPEDIAEAIAASSPVAREELSGGTIRDTNTAYEDRTYNPSRDDDVEYEVIREEVAGGTIIETYMEPIGGFPEVE